MRKPLLQLIIIQFKEFYREPGVLFWAFLFPVLMAWGLGIAFTKKNVVQHTIAIIENAELPDSSYRNMLNMYAKIDSVNLASTGNVEKWVRTGSEKNGYTEYKFVATTWGKAITLLKQGAIVLILQEKDGKLIYHYDPLNTEAQLCYLQLSNMISNNKTIAIVDNVEPLTQKGTRYIDFLIPGLIAMNLMMSALWGICYSLIEKRSKKLLRRMVATPMRKTDFMIAQLISRLALCLVEVVVLYVFAWYYFKITIEGSFMALILVYLAGMIFFTGLSVLLSSRTASTQVANGIINAVVMPMMLLSGIFFSYHNFPDAFVSIIKYLPLTLLADSIRSIFIEGAGILDVFFSIVILSATGIAAFFVGLKVYKWY
jgi:ABC-2 type transport system permease protein